MNASLAGDMDLISDYVIHVHINIIQYIIYHKINQGGGLLGVFVVILNM